MIKKTPIFFVALAVCMNTPAYASLKSPNADDNWYPVASVFEYMVKTSYVDHVYLQNPHLHGWQSLELILTADKLNNNDKTEFNGKKVYAKPFNITIKGNGEFIERQDGIEFYDPKLLRYVGSKNSNYNLDTKVVKRHALPKKAKVGSKQLMYEGLREYKANGDNDNIQLSKVVSYWSLTEASATTAKLCQEMKIYFTDRRRNKLNNCFIVNSQGDILDKTTHLEYMLTDINAPIQVFSSK